MSENTYLLFAWHDHYPKGGMRDCKMMCASRDTAEEEAKKYLDWDNVEIVHLNEMKVIRCRHVMMGACNRSAMEEPDE